MFPFSVPADTIMIWRPSAMPQEIAFTVKDAVTEDTEWVAFVPPQLEGQYISFLQSTSFTADGPQVIKMVQGSIYIGNKPL